MLLSDKDMALTIVRELHKVFNTNNMLFYVNIFKITAAGRAVTGYRSHD